MANKRSKAEEIVTKLRQVEDLTARNLRGRSSTQVGLGVTSLLDPFYAQLATGFQAVARARGYEVALIIDDADGKEELVAVDSLLAMGVGGIALTPVSKAALSRIDGYGLPVLQIDRAVSAEFSLIGGRQPRRGCLRDRASAAIGASTDRRDAGP